MILRKLIARLENANPEYLVSLGFNCPHSYRGSFEYLAFKPKKNITVIEMLDAAKSAVGSVYVGYKGGNFTMNENCQVYIARYGEIGEQIGDILLDYMLGESGTKKEINLSDRDVTITNMKRTWKPMDIGGLRLYEVRVSFPYHPKWNEHHIIAAHSPTHAADIYKRITAETIWIEEPHVKGFALNICQPEDWWSESVPCS